MNNIKFRPVGSPSAKVIVVRCSQSKQAIYGRERQDKKGYHQPQAISKAHAEKVMVRKGYVRAGVRA